MTDVTNRSVREIGGIGIQPVELQHTGWKPMPRIGCAEGHCEFGCVRQPFLSEMNQPSLVALLSFSLGFLPWRFLTR